MAAGTPPAVCRIRSQSPKSRDGNNKILHKRFPGGHLTIRRRERAQAWQRPPRRNFVPGSCCGRGGPLSDSATGCGGCQFNLARNRDSATFWTPQESCWSRRRRNKGSEPELSTALLRESDQRRFLGAVPGMWGGARSLTRPQVVVGPRVERGSTRPDTARLSLRGMFRCSWRDETAGVSFKKGTG